MQLLLSGLIEAVIGALSAASRRRRRYEGGTGTRTPLSIAAAVAVVAATAPLAGLALVAGRLALELLDDEMLIFLGLLIFGPVALVLVVLAVGVVAASIAVAPGVAAGSPPALVRAWLFVAIAALQAFTCLQMGLLLAAVATFAVAAVAGGLLVAVHRERRPPAAGPRFTV